MWFGKAIGVGILTWFALGVIVAIADLFVVPFMQPGPFATLITSFMALIGALVAFYWYFDHAPASKTRCDYCDERIRVGALVCRHCGREVADDDLDVA